MQFFSSALLMKGSLVFVFMSHLVHHLGDSGGLLSKCVSWLRPGGSVFVRYGAMEHIREDVVHRFFPEALEIDEAKAPTIDLVEGWLQAGGYTGVRTAVHTQQSFDTREQRLESIRLKGTSVLTLIDGAAFERGLAATRDYIRRNPDDPWLLRDTMCISQGRVSGPTAA